jgi:hypothetical protein
MEKHLMFPPSIASGDQRDVADIESEISVQYQRLSLSDQRFLGQLMDLPLLGTLPVEEERARMRAGQVAGRDPGVPHICLHGALDQAFASAISDANYVLPARRWLGARGPSDPHEAGV